jgi:hypothetical protein
MAADAVVVASPVSSIMTHFADLPDPRSPPGRRHELSDLLTIAICAVVRGADGWVQVEQFAHAKRAWFATFLSLPVPADRRRPPPVGGPASRAQGARGRELLAAGAARVEPVAA